MSASTHATRARLRRSPAHPLAGAPPRSTALTQLIASVLLLIILVLIGWQLTADTIIVPTDVPWRQTVTVSLLAVASWLTAALLVMLRRAMVGTPQPGRSRAQRARRPSARPPAAHLPLRPTRAHR
jgi:hypothetical protein